MRCQYVYYILIKDTNYTYFTMAEKLVFPVTFTFGVADSDLQVIGEEHTQKFENTAQTMWHSFAKSKQIATPNEGIDRYHKWQEDIKIMQKLGIKHYRTSVSMARTLDPNGSLNNKAISWYKIYFNALHKAGITLYVTLYHWELPQFLYERGGWTNQQTIDCLVKHTKTVYEHLGEFIEEYVLLNEPWTTVHLGHVTGDMAPGEKNITHSLLAAHYQLLAQGLMLRELSKHQGLKISTVYNVINSYAYTTDPKDILAMQLTRQNVNAWYLDPLFKGHYPEQLSEYYGRKMPKFTKEEMEIIRVGDKMHSLGINYYFSHYVQYKKQAFLYSEPVIPKGAQLNGLGWPFSAPPLYPEGFYDSLTDLYAEYKNYGLKRIYIAENGTAGDTKVDKKTQRVEDNMRIMYYHEHLRQLHKAIRAGVPIEKYFLWTLMDNYEWQNGYAPNAAFGIVHVDRKTLKRTPKKSAKWYTKILKTNTLIF